MLVYQKRGLWKVEGSAKKYNTEEEAKKAAGIADPLEALRNKVQKDGDIQEGFSDEPCDEREFLESPDRGLFGIAWNRTDSEPDSTD